MKRSISEYNEVGKSELSGTAFVSIALILISPTDESTTLSCDSVVSVTINDSHLRESVL